MLRRVSGGTRGRMSSEKLSEGLLTLAREADGREGSKNTIRGIGIKGELEGLGVARLVRGRISCVEGGSGSKIVSYRVVGEWLGRGGEEFFMEFEVVSGSTNREVWESAVRLVLDSTNNLFLSRLDMGVGVEVEVGGVKRVIRETSSLGFEDEGGDFWLWTEVKTSLKGESDE